MKARKFIQSMTAALVLAVAFAVPSVVPAVAGEATIVGALNNNVQKGANNVNSGNPTNLTPIIQNVINLLLFVVGIASVIMIIVGGLKYVTSSGDSNGINSAKNTILYSVVGLVVASLAFAIVNFVLKEL